MTEEGRDVFLLLDSITRTARAFNKWSNSGRTAQRLDIRAMIPKKCSAARQFERGSLTGRHGPHRNRRRWTTPFPGVQGTGNMELVLSRPGGSPHLAHHRHHKSARLKIWHGCFGRRDDAHAA
jgi:transcription termination factor Rho